ncbi:SRPBCC family protein [Fulvivirga sediminis]|nr:SRPBCC family protein [Fulvivirga sediminis]
MKSTSHTKEFAIDGVTSGLIGLHESVTWKAKHFGVWQKLTSRITEFQYPDYFVDEMEKGIFKSFRHEHHFRKNEDGLTEMVDNFVYSSPLGILGVVADNLFLKKYMSDLLCRRNHMIKEVAESNQWLGILK